MMFQVNVAEWFYAARIHALWAWSVLISLCACGADECCPHEKNSDRLPGGCLSGANFTGNALLSSSPVANNGSNAWIVNFNNGNDNWNNKNNSYYVRLVRGGV